jgi:phosphatidylglycerophosphate synthase
LQENKMKNTQGCNQQNKELKNGTGGYTLSQSWKNKPTDRFILKWIKYYLSARITPHLTSLTWLQPWMITVCSAVLGTFSGIVFATGSGFLAGLIAGAAQVLDGVDGQFARLTGKQSPAGAFIDSVLDRYADGALIIGMTIYLIRLPLNIPISVLLISGTLALIGSNLISYSGERGDNLKIDFGKPTIASKGTRTTVMVLCALGSVLWAPLPIVALFYLVLHPNIVVLKRIIQAYKLYSPDQ